MRNKTHGTHTKKSVIENQLIPINDKHQSQDIAAYYRTDRRDFKSSKMGGTEDWFEADEDSELEMFDIDTSDFQLPEDNF